MRLYVCMYSESVAAATVCWWVMVYVCGASTNTHINNQHKRKEIAKYICMCVSVGDKCEQKLILKHLLNLTYVQFWSYF